MRQFMNCSRNLARSISVVQRDLGQAEVDVGKDGSVTLVLHTSRGIGLSGT